MLTVGGMPGHHRYTTEAHRRVLYTIVIIMVTLAGIGLFSYWNHLEQTYDLEKAVLEGFDW